MEGPDPSQPRAQRDRGGATRGPAAGLFGTSAIIAADAVLHALLPSFPFPPLALAQAVVRAAPGGVATFFIDRLGHLAIPLAVATTIAGFFALGALLGLLLSRLVPIFGSSVAAGAASFVPMWAVSVASYPSPPGSMGRWAFAAVSLPLDLAGGAGAGWAFQRQGAARVAAPTDHTRRLVVRALWLGGLAVLIGVSDLRRLILRPPDPGKDLLALPDLVRAASPSAAPGDAGFASVAGLTSQVTPNDLFYVVDEEIIDPDIDPATWRLHVGGLVERPTDLTYEQLKELPAVERYQTLECISNEVGGDLISTAKWTGVPLREILGPAGVPPGAVEVVFRAAGGYSESLSIDQAMDPTTLVAIGMNDHVLPRAHGFPARILSVGTYGMKNPKWLTGIEVVDRPYTGFWERRGWSKPAAVKTMSRIDVPEGGTVGPASVVVAGVAFAGTRGISRVEVSTDGGASWVPAQLETALSPYTWRRWLFRWRPAGGRQAQILVRAYDDRGALQTAVTANPHPSGASGYHAIKVRYESG